MSRINKVLLAVILLCSSVPLLAQDQKPLTNQEFVKLLYQLPRSPETRDDLIEQIRRRGIGFPLTDGMRGLVATKSGNDALLRRTLEEAERRRVNPTASALPSENDGHDLLDLCRSDTLTRKMFVAVSGRRPQQIANRVRRQPIDLLGESSR